MRALVVAVALGMVWQVSGAHAQTMPPEVRALSGPAGQSVRLVTSWGRSAKARLFVDKAKAQVVHDGAASGTLVAGHERVVVAVSVLDKTHPFRVRVLSQGALGAVEKVARPGKRNDVPFAVAATATPDGFSLFFQEVEADNPGEAHTYLVKLDREGKPVGDATEVPVPWSLGAAAWNGAGYHLALFYPGGGEGMRLSMVSLSPEGQPQQHPDWASAAGFIADVHLHAEDGKVLAFYRGGAAGDRLLESDVSAIRGWGSEPPKAKDHGVLPAAKVIALGKGARPEAIKRPR